MAKRRKRSAVDRALFHMRPGRVVARFISSGRHQTFGAIAKSPFKPKTVHTAKSGRRAYQQRVARERKAQAKAAVAERKQAAANQRAARAELRAQQPRPARTRQQPAAVNPRTGRALTWRDAEKGMCDAQREARRIEDELAGRIKPLPKPRKPRAPKPEPAPLQRAVADVQKQQPRKTTRPTSKKKPAAKPKPRAAKKLAPPPDPTKAPGKTINGIVMAAACACQGTGRIAVIRDGLVAGSTSCPVHGRAGKARGQRKRTTKGAMRDSGLPGLAAWLRKRRTRKRGNSDRRQFEAWKRANSQGRLTGPTLPCEWCEAGHGISERRETMRLREELKAKLADEALAAGKNAPSKRKLIKLARRAYPHELCSHCKGLGVVSTSVTLTPDGRQPVGEWRATAGLREGHRPTGREQATGKRMSKNARRVERKRILPRT